MRKLRRSLDLSDLFHRNRGAVTFANNPQHRETKKDEGRADEGPFKVAGIAPDEHDGRAGNEDRRQDGIAPDAIGTLQLRIAAAIDEDRSGGEHVEEPLGEHGQLKVLLKLAEEEKEHGGEQSLDDK